MLQVKEAFVKNKHLRFRQELSGGEPFGKPSDYSETLKKADNQRIAKLIRIAGVLMQTKVYLFWKNTACP